MAASPPTQEQAEGKWGFGDDPENMGPMSSTDPLVDDAPLAADETISGHLAGTPGHKRTPSGDNGVSGSKTDSGREKTFKTNKVYIGGLPDHTRQEDLQSCFGKIGRIVHIELKIGYGFVEFDTREAADESVAKYNEGYFMGNKIRVELSHGRGRTTRRSDDPGACFRCGETGHWARECPRLQTLPRGPPHDAGLIDRLHPPRDYLPPPRDYGPPGRYPPAQDARYYDYPPLPPPPSSGRDFRPVSPMRDRRDYSAGPPPRSRDYDDYRMRGPPPPPPSRYDRPYDREPPPRSYPPPRDYDRYERRPPPDDRYAPSLSRPRTPPGPPPRREDYDRPPRDYIPVDTRARPITPPPRPLEYRRSHSPEQPRYRRRSLSPPPRSAHYDTYPGANGYSGDRPVPMRDDKRIRDYPPRRDGPEAGYRRP
ncbi:hypothetical protein AZE42_05071 [Rhizopogon vesiculosus]|uniref:RNA-binding domain-containing protein n=1 Tax=Rhizopogon vesiculosus TaxID=180088 RepID=A0A1J8PUL5_9AGAM|nr:hypothetical protein AZE42_05071 [Rhizopogon vesiculosus]